MRRYNFADNIGQLSYIIQHIFINLHDL